LLVINSLCLAKDHLSNPRSCNEDYLHGIGDKNQRPENKQLDSQISIKNETERIGKGKQSPAAKAMQADAETGIENQQQDNESISSNPIPTPLSAQAIRVSSDYQKTEQEMEGADARGLPRPHSGEHSRPSPPLA